MLWLSPLYKFVCEQVQVEAEVIGDNTVLFICPKIPPPEVQLLVLGGLPVDDALQYKFVEAPTTKTMGLVTEVVKHLKGHINPPDLSMKDHHVSLRFWLKNEDYQRPDSKGWLVIRELLVADPYVESFEIQVNDKRVLAFNRKG